MTRLLFLVTVLLSIPGVVYSQQVNILVVAIRGVEAAKTEWQPSIDYLNEKLPQHDFKLVTVIPSELDKIKSLLHKNQIDFVITQPAIYVELELGFGISKILTMVKRGGYSQFGSTIITRSDSGIKNLLDLRGRKIAGVAKLGFGGWLIGYKEMLDHGFDPFLEAEEVVFLGTQVKEIQAVLDGQVDAAVVRTGMLEKYLQKANTSADTFRILSEKNYPGFQLKISTPLYPEWAFARTHRASNELSKEVALALLSMKANSIEAQKAGFQEWTFPYDYQPVHDLLKELQVGPYQAFGKVELMDAIAEHWKEALMTIFLVFTVFTVVIVWNRKLEREIANRKRIENTLRKSEEELQLHAKVYQTSTEGIIITDPESRIIAVNKQFTEISGFQEKEVLGQNPRIFSSGKHDSAFYQQLWSSLLEEGYWEGEIHNRCKDGQLIIEWLRISRVTNNRGDTTHFVALLSDITQKKLSDQELHRRAYSDTLTGLNNRLSFEDRLEQEISRAHRNNSRFAVFYIDLNKFKPINDTFGHQAGDHVLCAVANRLEQVIREIDTAARVGGDEFALLLPDIIHPDETEMIASRIIEALHEPTTFEGQDLTVGASIGIAVYPDSGTTAEQLIQVADKAMYRAKSDSHVNIASDLLE